MYVKYASDLAFRTDEATHVLHHSDDWKLDFLTESDLFSHVLQRHLLERERESEKQKDGKRLAKQEKRVDRRRHRRSEDRREGNKDTLGIRVKEKGFVYIVIPFPSDTLSSPCMCVEKLSLALLLFLLKHLASKF